MLDIVSVLETYGVTVDIHDPWVNPEEAKQEYGVELVKQPQPDHYDAIIIAVAHSQFKEYGLDTLRGWGRETHVLYDLKYLFDQSETDLRL